ncbi:MAG: hypothetical protein AAGA36_05455 [Pseudomonadota bacterium]
MPPSANPWSQIGLAALLAGTTALTSCGETQPVDAEAPTETAETAAAPAAPAAPADDVAAPAVPQGGEGEGGVAIEAAAYDPVVYGSAIAIAKAHILAARDAYAAGETESAGEMFAHPASEVLADMQPIFEGLGVEPFSDLFLDASDAVFNGAPESDIAARTETILAALTAAGTKAPKSDASAGDVAVGVVTDQVDRAADMYAIAKENAYYGSYLDGYGFYKAAADEFAAGKDAIEEARPDLIPVIEGVLSSLSKAYPIATLPDTMPTEPGELIAQVSQLKLAI